VQFIVTVVSTSHRTPTVQVTTAPPQAHDDLTYLNASLRMRIRAHCNIKRRLDLLGIHCIKLCHDANRLLLPQVFKEDANTTLTMYNQTAGCFVDVVVAVIALVSLSTLRLYVRTPT
jgi:hypothetical protein